MVEQPLMEQWVVGSIRHGGPTELFLIPASAHYGMCYIVCGMVHIKKYLAANWREQPK